MKLAEALIERAELKKKNGQLVSRIKTNTKVQEGDQPAEKPDELIAEYEKNMSRLLELVQKINETNCMTRFDGTMTVADAIARRDYLGSKIKAYREFYESSVIKIDRYSKNEIKFVRCIDAKGIQDKINSLSKEYRETDTKIQGLNWTTDIL
jgi:uncharacterized protein YydD (DUF2326 family)